MLFHWTLLRFPHAEPLAESRLARRRLVTHVGSRLNVDPRDLIGTRLTRHHVAEFSPVEATLLSLLVLVRFVMLNQRVVMTVAAEVVRHLPIFEPGM